MLPSSGAIGPLELVVVLVIILLYLLPSYLVARFAERKGHSFGGFLVLGIFLSWIVSLVVALLVEDKRTPRTVVTTPPSGDHLDRLQKLTELRNAGTLSADEFEAEKARILAERSA